MSNEKSELSSVKIRSEEDQIKEYLSTQMIDLSNRVEALPKITLFNNNLKAKYVTGRRRMKIYIKLNKDETENFEYLKEVFKGQASTDDITRQIFLKGLDAVNKELHEGLEKVKAEAERVQNEGLIPPTPPVPPELVAI